MTSCRHKLVCTIGVPTDAEFRSGMPLAGGFLAAARGIVTDSLTPLLLAYTLAAGWCPNPTALPAGEGLVVVLADLSGGHGKDQRVIPTLIVYRLLLAILAEVAGDQ